MYLKFTEYVSVTSGSTCQRITSKEECEEAAKQLGFTQSNIGASLEDDETNFPPYCYFYSRGPGSLWFNENGNSAVPCKGGVIRICKKTVPCRLNKSSLNNAKIEQFLLNKKSIEQKSF